MKIWKNYHEVTCGRPWLVCWGYIVDLKVLGLGLGCCTITKLNLSLFSSFNTCGVFTFSYMRFFFFLCGPFFYLLMSLFNGLSFSLLLFYFSCSHSMWNNGVICVLGGRWTVPNFLVTRCWEEDLSTDMSY